MRSGFEETVKKFLKKLKVKFEYEPLRIPYVIEAEYIPDFVVFKKSHKGKKALTINTLGDTFIIETKGILDASERHKLTAIKRSNPSLDIRLVFQADNYLSKLTKEQKLKKSEGIELKKMRYTDWAKLHNFPCAVGSVPQEWLNE